MPAVASKSSFAGARSGDRDGAEADTDRLRIPERMKSPARGAVRRCLIALALALLLVGVVSGTVLRHIVQIVPIAVAWGVLARRSWWGAYAALPIFVFWTCIPVLIWLFLLGLSRFANGHYTPIEVGATVVMAAASGIGVVKCVQLGRPLRATGRLSMFLLFAVMQFAAMWVSFLGPIANR